MESLTSLFNLAGSVGYYAAYAATFVAVAGLGYVGTFKGPRQLTPENGTARVITARRWPKVWSKDKIVAREGPEMYVKWGASGIDDIPLETFRVSVTRSGKDAALVLKDKVKAQVDAEFFVRVDATSDRSIIQAMEALGGRIDKAKIQEYCLPKFDAALRAAAAELEIEQIQSEREQFSAAVKKALDSLSDDGLVLIDVALRQLDQSPLEDFDLNNYFDAQGYEKVVKTTEVSRQKINDQKQDTDTKIASRNKDEAKIRFGIEREQKEAELTKNEEIAALEATNREKVAEYDATSRKAAEAAKIATDKAVELDEIGKQKEVQVANEQRERAIEIEKADKTIALSKKSEEQAAAEQAANEKKAEAVQAEEAVKTARQVAEANREKEVSVIAARQEAEKSAEGEKIAADAQVYVAEKGKDQAQALADAVLIEAKAEKEAAVLSAAGAYEEIFQKAKAVADGDLKQADAQKAINEAVNSLSETAQAHLVEMARVTMTPEAIRESMKGVEKINGINITSMDGVAGMFGGAAGAGGDGHAVGGSDPMSQMVTALMTYKMAEPLMGEIISNVGGDVAIAKNVPGTSVAAKEVAAKPATPTPGKP